MFKSVWLKLLIKSNTLLKHGFISTSPFSGSPDPLGGQIFSMHASGQAGARPHQGKASDRTQLCLLCAQRSLRLCPDLRGRMLGVNTSPNFFLFWMYTFKSIILASSVFLFVAEYFSCVGKVADAFQHSAVKREKQAVWISLPSGPQVGPIWSRSFIYSTTEYCVGGGFQWMWFCCFC